MIMFWHVFRTCFYSRKGGEGEKGEREGKIIKKKRSISIAKSIQSVCSDLDSRSLIVLCNRLYKFRGPKTAGSSFR